MKGESDISNKRQIRKEGVGRGREDVLGLKRSRSDNHAKRTHLGQNDQGALGEKKRKDSRTGTKKHRKTKDILPEKKKKPRLSEEGQHTIKKKKKNQKHRSSLK